jgi:2-polyprenyl-6-methoxyphenol hydroxylase-like FAD-dependent oxidoreductase
LWNVNAGGDLLSALAGYERGMVDYGFAAVRASLLNMKRLHTRAPFKRFASKALFRLADASPKIQRLINIS